jgi:predicted dehydrogenase
MRELKIGVIACSGRGRNAWLAHQPERGVRIVAGADVRKEALDEFRQNFPEAALFCDYRGLLKMKEIDAVFISSPLEFHEQMTMDALEAGKAVYLEKPMAPTIEACDRIMAKAERDGLKLFVGHNLRCFPFLRALKETIDSGAIGEVRSIWCRHFVGYGRHSDDYFRHWAQPRFRYGMLLHKGCHDIDAIHWLGGARSRSVVGMGSFSVFNESIPSGQGQGQGEGNAIGEREDHNMILMELANGVQAAYLQCGFTPDDSRNYTVTGTKGRVENTGCNYGKSLIHLWSNQHGDTAGSVREVSAPGGDAGSIAADKETVSQFLDYVRGGEKSPIAPLDARCAVAAALLGRRSMRNGSAPAVIPDACFS